MQLFETLTRLAKARGRDSLMCYVVHETVHKDGVLIGPYEFVMAGGGIITDWKVHPYYLSSYSVWEPAARYICGQTRSLGLPRTLVKFSVI